MACTAKETSAREPRVRYLISVDPKRTICYNCTLVTNSVEKMAQIIAWKSETDGKIFEDKKKYQNHLRTLARHRLAQKRLKIAEVEKDALWAELYEREQSIDDWMQMVIDNQHLFWAEAAAGDPHDWQNVGKKLGRGKNAANMPMPKVLKITHSLRWSDSVSNSHSCPHNGMTNWGGRETMKDGSPAPRGYPGWAGHIEWLVEWPEEFDYVYLGSDLFSKGSFRSGRQRAHTGTGGGAGGHFNKEFNTWCQRPQYDFKIFAADWPGMTRYYEKMKMWDTLKQRG